MRNVLLAALATSAALLANGCVPFGCGGLEGQGNRAFERNSEMIMLCENGGFVASLETTMLEGRFIDESGMVRGTRGEDGNLAFELFDNYDGTAFAPQLGAELWTSVALDEVAAHHANNLCTELSLRGWWTQPTTTFQPRTVKE